jgi:hypothetical protein
VDDDLNLPEDRPQERVFYCEQCRQPYPLARWTITAHGDDDPIGSWYDCAQIRCRSGHERHLDLSISTYENRRAGTTKATRCGGAPKIGAFHVGVLRVSKVLGRRSTPR